MTSDEKEQQPYDPLRDGPLRYMGYCNEVGEAFRPLVNVNWVRLSYVGSFGYVFADTYDKVNKAANVRALIMPS